MINNGPGPQSRLMQQCSSRMTTCWAQYRLSTHMHRVTPRVDRLLARLGQRVWSRDGGPVAAWRTCVVGGARALCCAVVLRMAP